jgi:DNA modification methylase
MQAVEIAAWMTKHPTQQKYYNSRLSSRVTNVFSEPITSAQGARKKHPTQKPLYTALWLVALFSKRGDVVLAPFAGAGTFPVAVKLLGRRPIWAESDPE